MNLANKSSHSGQAVLIRLIDGHLQSLQISRTKSLVSLCILTLILLLPFVGRPFHIDDPQFIWAAKQIVQHPLDFYGFSVNWEGYTRPMWRIFPIPPLMSYYLAAVSRITGWNEAGLHLAMLPVSILTIAGFFCLAERFCKRPGLCVFLLLICPAFWVSATTLMCETPLVCFWVWGICLWIWGSEKSAWFFIPAAGVLSLAMLTKFTAIGLLPLLVLHAIFARSCTRARIVQIATLVWVVFVFAGYEHLFHDLYHVGALENAAEYSRNSRAILGIPFLLRLLNTLAFVGGGGLVACLCVLCVIWPGWARFAVVVTILLATFAIASTALPPSGWIASSPSDPGQLHASVSPGSVGFSFQYAAMTVLGGVAFLFFSRSLARAVRTGQWTDDLFLVTWIVGVFIFAAFLNWSINARTVLPMLPAVCIMVVRSLDRVKKLPPLRTTVCLTTGMLIAMAVTVGDYRLAVIGKTAAARVHQQVEPDPGSDTRNADAKLWVTGHWGLQYYLQLEGFTEWDLQNSYPNAGDLFVFSSNGFGGTPRADGFLLIKDISVGTGGWVATAAPGMGAGFYHSDGYALPFVFGPMPRENFALVKATASSRVYP